MCMVFAQLRVAIAEDLEMRRDLRVCIVNFLVRKCVRNLTPVRSRFHGYVKK